MPRHSVILVALFAVAVVARCGGSHVLATTEPPWVSRGVEALRVYFPNAPKPERVTWGTGATTRWVTVFFAKPEMCNCPAPPPDGVVKGRSATITWDTATPGKGMSLSVPAR